MLCSGYSSCYSHKLSLLAESHQSRRIMRVVQLVVDRQVSKKEWIDFFSDRRENRKSLAREVWEVSSQLVGGIRAHWQPARVFCVFLWLTRLRRVLSHSLSLVRDRSFFGDPLWPARRGGTTISWMVENGEEMVWDVLWMWGSEYWNTERRQFNRLNYRQEKDATYIFNWKIL